MMSRISVKQKIKAEMSESQQLFPLSVSTEESSLNYMKRLTAVAISNILYLRNVFTEECYGHRKLDQLKLRILTEKCEPNGAKQIVYWVKGCFDAMQKKYLKQLTLGIYTDPLAPDDLIEAYTFRYTYESNRLNISINQNQREIKCSEQTIGTELRTATTQLLRSIIIMVQSLDRLPKDCFLTMKLLYYENTPIDYEPPGFEPSENHSFTFKGKPISISAGELITPFHSLKVKIRTNQEQFQDFADSDNSSQNKKMRDECSPLNIDDSSQLIEESQDLPQKALTNSDSESKGKTGIKNSKSFKKQEINSSVSTKENIKVGSVESNVISKMNQMKVNDNSPKEVNPEVNKRKFNRNQDFEVTQDSVFNSMPTDKRFKASKTKSIQNLNFH